MRSIVLIQALVASMGSMAHAAFADSYAAQQALQSYLDKNPISTRSAENSQATMSLESLKESVLAGNYSLTRSWGFLLESCPGSCTDLGVDSQAWPVYHSVDRLSRCDETMILSFALYNNLAVSNSQISIRGCTADLQAGSTSYDNSSCEVPVNTTTVTSSLQLAWNTAAATGSVSEAIDSMEQLLAYENMNSLPCNETIKFAYSGQTSVGVYMGSALHRQGLLPSVIQDFIDQVKHEDVTRTQLVQLCDDEKSARYTMGIIINSAGDLSATQQAVQTWRNGSCVTTLESTSTWNNLTFSTPMTSHRSSNATYNWNRRNTERKLLARDTCTAIQVHGGDTCTSLATECGITTAELTTYNPSSTPCTTALTVGEWICCTSGSAPDYTPSPDADGTCYSYTVKEGDDCSALAATYTITVDDIESYNLDTWGWMGCGLLFADMNICLSSGYAPMPAVISNAVCGPQVNGTATVPHGTDLSTINQCPLNACCDKWGQCGITSEFCTQVNSTINAPGTSANGTNGCISNCGTHIIESDAPSEYFTIGYFEGFDLERACLRPLITEIDTTNYTHIHMSFATLNADFSFNISSIETQMDAFTDLLDVKRVVSVGGWAFSTDPSTYDIFREAVSTDVNRATLVTNTLNFLDQYGLDGIDWDWEYPSEPDIPGIPADSTDSAQNLFLFLMDLYQQMPAGKTVSTTAPSSYWYMKQYPIEAISKVVHYIVMMTYDMHGQWDWNNTQTEDQCPTGSCLRSHVNLTETLSAMSMITKAGVPSNMVALGVASYARSFQMTEAGCYGPDCFFTGPDSGATPGVCTNTAGYISNAELYGIADEQSIYTYIDADSNSNIMIWNDTQWAAFMEDSVKDTRRGLYKQMSFLGTADWAIDLLEGNLTATTPACEIYIDPTVWSEASPTITGEPGCTLIWPPKPLASNTTITFPPWPTHLTWQSGATSVTTFYSGASPVTYESISTISVPTLLSIPPLVIDSIPVWYQLPSSGQTDLTQTSSILQTPFTVVVTPTIGGTTQVTGGTISTVSSVSYASGNYSFYSPEWTGVFGGTTLVTNGTVLPAITHTVTPHPYPTQTDSTTDPVLNSVKTKYSSTSTGGGPVWTPKVSFGCFPFCHLGCPLCPPGSDGGGGGGSGSDEGDGDGESSTQSESSSSTSSESAYATLPAMETVVFVDPVVTTDDLSALQALATARASLMDSLYGSEISYVLTASDTNTNTITTGPTTTTATATTTTPTTYTITDIGGDILACQDVLVIQLIAGIPITQCLGSVSTISTATPTPTPCVKVDGMVSSGLQTQFEVDIKEDGDITCSFKCGTFGDDCTASCSSGYSAEAKEGDDLKTSPLTVTYSAPYGDYNYSVDVVDYNCVSCCGESNPACSCCEISYYGAFLNC